MRKTITISEIECEFKSSAAIPRMYRLKFGRDIFVDMEKLQKQVDKQERLKADGKEEGSSLPIDSLEMFENIAFLMHKHGDPSQPSDIDEWLEQFDVFSIYEEEGSSLPIDSLEMFENIAFLMHKHGDPSQPSDIDEWLEQFDVFSIYEVLPEILEMWNLENKQTSTPKKKTGK